MQQSLLFFCSKPFENSFRGGAELEPDTDAVAPGHPEIRRSVCTETQSQDVELYESEGHRASAL